MEHLRAGPPAPGKIEIVVTLELKFIFGAEGGNRTHISTLRK